MRLIFLGPPGAGKGTAAAKTATEFKIPHISTGELFRAAIKNQSQLGQKVKAITEKGDLVPDKITVELVAERLGNGDTKKGFILDGFPRTVPQAEALSEMSEISRVLNFELDDDEIIERISGRRVCRSCGKGYHVRFMPPKQPGVCDACGGELYTRKDDSVESIRNRLKVYKTQTAPLVTYYSDGNLVTNVDASPSPDEVFAALLEVLREL